MIPNYTLNLLTLQVVSISSTPTFVLVKNYVYLKIDIIWWNVIFCSENDEVQAWLMFRILCRKPLALLLVPYRAYLPTCTLYLDPHCSAHLGGKNKTKLFCASFWQRDPFPFSPTTQIQPIDIRTSWIHACGGCYDTTPVPPLRTEIPILPAAQRSGS